MAEWLSVGLLSEGAGTNEALQSEVLNVYSGGGIVTANTTVAPDGTTTADTITDDDAGNFENILQSRSSLISDSEAWCFSVYVLKDSVAKTTRFPRFDLSFTGGTPLRATINLATDDGEVLLANITGAPTKDGGVIDEGLWWRVWITMTNNATGNTTADMYLYPAVGANADLTTTSVAAVGSIVAWGVQLENNTFPTSYMGPTTTVAVNRAADNYTANIGSLDSPVTVAVAFRTGWGGTGTETILQIDDGTTDESITVTRNAGDVHVIVRDAGAEVADLDLGALANNTSAQVALICGDADFKATLNQGTKVTVGSGTAPTGMTTARYGVDQGGINQLFGYVTTVDVWSELIPEHIAKWHEDPDVKQIDLCLTATNLADAAVLGPTPVWTGASGRTYFDSTGTLVFGRENLLKDSDGLTTSNSEINATIDSSSITGPYGSALTDNILVEDGTTNEHYVISTPVAFTLGLQFTISIHVKATSASREWVGMSITNGLMKEASSRAYMSFHLSGAGSTGTSGGGDFVSASIEALGNDWYRLSLLINGFGGSRNLGVYMMAADDTPSYAGDGTTALYYYGRQAERHATARAYISTAGSEVYKPRLASHLYDGAAWVNKGYLSEEARTNLALHSGNFGNTVWDNAGAQPTVTDNTHTAPDGTTTADTIDDQNVVSYHFSSQNLTSLTNQTYCFSIYLHKTAGTHDFPGLQLNLNSANAQVIIDKANGTLSADGNVLASGVIDAGDYWRVWLTRGAGAVTTGQLKVFPAFGSDATTISAAETGTTVWWGAQLEAGAFPTSMILTTTATVSRAADIMYWANSSSELDAYGLTETGPGTFVLDASVGYATLDSSYGRYVGSTGGTQIFHLGTTLQIQSYDDAGQDTLYTVPANNTSFELATGWDGVSEIRSSGDGAAVGSNTYDGDWDHKAGTQDYGIGATSTQYSINAHIARIRFYDTLKDDTFLLNPVDPPTFVMGPIGTVVASPFRREITPLMRAVHRPEASTSAGLADIHKQVQDALAKASARPKLTLKRSAKRPSRRPRRR